MNGEVRFVAENYEWVRADTRPANWPEPPGRRGHRLLIDGVPNLRIDVAFNVHDHCLMVCSSGPACVRSTRSPRLSRPDRGRAVIPAAAPRPRFHDHQPYVNIRGRLTDAAGVTTKDHIETMSTITHRDAVAADQHQVWDYIIIGGGHNGLTAACTLAEGGMSVLELEQLPGLGGLSSSGRYLESAPEHVLSLGAMDDVLMSSTSLAQDLHLPRHGHAAVRLDQSYGGWIDAGVERVLADRGRAWGVLLFDGTELEARRGVLATVAPQLALASC